VTENLPAVHFDSNLFENPEKFQPERHLDDNGNFIKSKYVIPFSLGPRDCLGKQIAYTEVFIYLVSLIKNFEFLSKTPIPSINSGLDENFYVPPTYLIIARRR